MITNYFQTINTPRPIITEYYELHRNVLNNYNLKEIINEIKPYFTKNATRESCVCMNDEIKKDFNFYNLPIIKWTPNIFKIREELSIKYNSQIDYGLVHYYANEKSVINWHSDDEATKSNIFSVSFGGVRRFCLRDKITLKVHEFNLRNGDLFIMKIGCQNKYQHCIKSIKKYNEPRISITFRQMENSLLFYTYDVSNKQIILDTIMPSSNYTKITSTRNGINIGIISDEQSSQFTSFCISKNNITNLVKSNLQKAIRRKLSDIALQSVMYLIRNKNIDDLLRRLTIISFEDVFLTQYYPIIVWYYIATLNKYILTNYDVNFIYSYTLLLCNNNAIHDFNKLEPIDDDYEPHINDIRNNINCVSLYLRKLYGGFSGEKKIMNLLIKNILNNKINIEITNIQICEHILYSNPVPILNCAIDFHCFVKMPERVKNKIGNDSITEEIIREYIWNNESNINLRNNENNYNTNDHLWNNIIKPKCDIYRYQIANMLEIENLIEMFI